MSVDERIAIVNEKIELETGRLVKRANGLFNRRPRKPLGFATLTEVFFGKPLGGNFAFQG